MTLTIIIDMDDDALCNDPDELDRVLDRLKGRIQCAQDDRGSVRDSNGNTVGRWTVTEP